MQDRHAVRHAVGLESVHVQTGPSYLQQSNHIQLEGVRQCLIPEVNTPIDGKSMIHFPSLPPLADAPPYVES